MKNDTLNTAISTLSVVLATRNEEENIGNCLESVKKIADEIILVDEGSADRTREIAESYGAKVFEAKHETNFHITKQKALDYASKYWILQLDADERLTPELAKEIVKVINLNNSEIEEYESKQMSKHLNNYKLFKRHEDLINKREGKSTIVNGEYVAFYIPRLNFFLGKPLTHAGVFPDGVIRLVKKGKAYFPAKSVHELIETDGRVGWLFNNLEHHDSPTIKRYLERANRYTDLTSDSMKKINLPKNYLFMFYYSFIKPTLIFLNLYIRHRGYMDGIRGFIWSVFSGLHYPIAYFKFWLNSEDKMYSAKY